MTDVQNLDIHVLSQFAAERVTHLRRTVVQRDLPRRALRRRLGEQLVRLAWVAAEPVLRPVAAR